MTTFNREKIHRLKPKQIVLLGNYVLRHMLENPEIEYFAYECEATAQEVNGDDYHKIVQFEVSNAGTEGSIVIPFIIHGDGFIYIRRDNKRNGSDMDRPSVIGGYVLSPMMTEHTSYDLSAFENIMNFDDTKPHSKALIKT